MGRVKTSSRQALLTLCVAGVVTAGGVLTGCSSTQPGDPVIAPYTAPSVESLTATSLGAPKAARVAAISPDGKTAAVLAGQRLCLVPTAMADTPASGRCLDDKGIGNASNLVSFSGNGATVMVMPNVQTLSSVPLYLVSTSTATAIAVAAPTSPSATTSSPSTSSAKTTSTTKSSTPGSLWFSGNWNESTGRLIAITLPAGNTQAMQVVEIDPATGKVTVLGPAADPKDYLSGPPVVGGSVLLYPIVNTSSSRRSNLIVFDLTTHQRRELVDVTPVGVGTMRVVLSPVVISPDGTRALVAVQGGSANARYPAQVLDLTTGVFTALPGNTLPQAAAYSPDGRLLAVLQLNGRSSELAITATSVGDAGAKGSTDTTDRVVSTVTGTSTLGPASMRWSRTNVLSLSSLGYTLRGELAGWTLR
ncbi:hypothetical protein ABIB25_002843 [Nakamurella sp. UYEF19]|uniref:hypothetical protein n=1 Tax=Nakamurella sp. UYEF19 TaxID=1756392 RepID=UPI0033916AF0